MHFLALFFVLFSVTIYEASHFHQAFLNSFIKSLLFYFWQQFLVVSVFYLLILRLLYLIQPFIIFTKLLQFLCKILTRFLLIVPEKCKALFLFHHFLQQLLEILFVVLLSDQHLKLIVCLSQLQLVCNYL